LLGSYKDSDFVRQAYYSLVYISVNETNWYPAQNLIFSQKSHMCMILLSKQSTIPPQLQARCSDVLLTALQIEVASLDIDLG